MADPVDIIEITEALKGNLESLVEEKKKLRQQAQEVDIKISALHQSLSGLLLYADALDETDPKLTALVKSIGELLYPSSSSSTLMEACRTALRTKRRMSALEVRKALEASGFDFSGYTSNPLSSIHTTLRRLKENDEVRITTTDGTKYYSLLVKRTPATGILAPAFGKSLSELLSERPINSLMPNIGVGIEVAPGIMESMRRLPGVDNLGILNKLVGEKKK